MRIDTRNPIALAMTSIGILLICVTLVYALAVKAPDPKASVTPIINEISKHKHEYQHATEVKDKSLASIQARLWTDPDDRIAPKTLKIVTDLAQTHTVKMSAFRPQKETAAGALMILPFFVTIEGPFPAVANYLKDFEENQQTLIVNNVQIASSDQNTHTVTASLEVSAYIDPNRDAGDATVATKPSVTIHAKPSQTSSPKTAAHSDRAMPRIGARA